MPILEKLEEKNVAGLDELNLSENPGWFSDEESLRYVADFIQKQVNLQVLYLDWNKLSGQELTRILNAINARHSRNTLRKLYLNGCNFESDEACEALAKLVANQLCLQYLNIRNQFGEQSIDVQVVRARK